MTATLKTTIIQEPSSVTANITLDTSGNVAIGGSATAGGVPVVTTTGTQTLTNKTLTSPTLNSPAINTPIMGGSVLTRDTVKSSTSGTSVEFTNIPSWARRITIMVSGVSTTGTSAVMVQLGTSSGYTTSGYSGTAMNNVSGASTSNMSAGFLTQNAQDTAAASIRHGIYVLTNLTGNVWCFAASSSLSNTNLNMTGSGSVSISGTVDRVRVTTVGGTDTFDAGTINIMYE